jgi:hypothetical protein
LLPSTDRLIVKPFGTCSILISSIRESIRDQPRNPMFTRIGTNGYHHALGVKADVDQLVTVLLLDGERGLTAATFFATSHFSAGVAPACMSRGFTTSKPAPHRCRVRRSGILSSFLLADDAGFERAAGDCVLRGPAVVNAKGENVARIFTRIHRTRPRYSAPLMLVGVSGRMTRIRATLGQHVRRASPTP